MPCNLPLWIDPCSDFASSLLWKRAESLGDSQTGKHTLIWFQAVCFLNRHDPPFGTQLLYCIRCGYSLECLSMNPALISFHHMSLQPPLNSNLLAPKKIREGPQGLHGHCLLEFPFHESSRARSSWPCYLLSTILSSAEQGTRSATGS